MDDGSRERVVMAHEGHVLSMASQIGTACAGENARAAIDGMMNGLIRLEGRRAAAVYAFALADRVVGGIKGATEWHPLSRPSGYQPEGSGGLGMPPSGGSAIMRIVPVVEDAPPRRPGVVEPTTTARAVRFVVEVARWWPWR
jgi:hypothetical protein